MSADSYQRFARRYDKVFEPLNEGLRQIGLKLAPPAEGLKVLDVGCGTGTHLELYAQRGCQVTGLDMSPSMLEIAQEKLGEQADLRLGDATAMPYGDDEFDLSMTMLMLHELDEATQHGILQEMKRVTRPGGQVLLIDFHPGPLKGFKGYYTKLLIFLSELYVGGEHFRNYRKFIAKDGLAPLVAANGFEVKRQRVVGGGALVLWLLGV